MLEMLEHGAQQDMGKGPELRARNNFSLGGRTINPDTELFGILRAMGSTVLLLPYQHGWLNTAGEVLLPHTLNRPSISEIEAVQSVLNSAAAWHSWERAQVRARLAQSIGMHECGKVNATLGSLHAPPLNIRTVSETPRECGMSRGLADEGD